MVAELALCSVPGCERARKTRGFCHAHYMRLWYSGKVRAERPIESRVSGLPLADRFWSKVRKGSPTECWEWQAAVQAIGRKGYGVIRVAKRNILAHRLAYELTIGPIPEGLQLDHLCRNPRCVNPAHLEPVTNWENGRRGISPPAQHARATHCLLGHPFDEANTYWTPRHTRGCRTCRKRQRAEYHILTGK